MHHQSETTMISLTFDDALDEHLDHAIPILDSHGFLGTFYTHLAAPAFGRRLDEWRAVANRGHELGNHTVLHPADSRKPWVTEGKALDYYTLDRMRLELESASQLLEGLDGRSERTFAFPCSNPILGRRGLIKSLLYRFGFESTRLPGIVDRWRVDVGSTQASYAPLLPDRFVAARGGGLTLDRLPGPLGQFDRYCLPSAAVESWSFEQLTDYTHRGLQSGGWVILQFHGITGGHRMDCGRREFDEFVTWLADEYSGIVVTMIDYVRRIWETQSVS